MQTRVFPFSFGDRNMGDLLGGKGANLAEMVKLQIPVPDGFTISTRACQDFLISGVVSVDLLEEVDLAVAQLEESTGKKFGDPTKPLLVSVRSGAKFSMPGMMETVLNVGISPEIATALAELTGDARFAWDSYRRFIDMYGRIVYGISNERFEVVRQAVMDRHGVANIAELTPVALRELGDAHIKLIEEVTGEVFPFDAQTQLRRAIEAVFHSWNSDRAQLYRRRERISNDLGTAVNVQMMVFGNIGESSGTGVCFTRNPSTGETGAYGDYLPMAQGEDVVAGIRNSLPLSELEELDNKSFNELQNIMRKLESHYRDMCDIEFTIESGKLWILQTRVGKRTAEAAFRIASHLVGEGMITMDQAISRVSGKHLSQLMFPQFDKSVAKREIARGIAASPGAAVGKVVFESSRAADMALAGEKVILVRRETSPEDLAGMVAAQGILTSRGGKTSHAAVVARGMGRAAVCGAEAIEVNNEEKLFRVGELVVYEGEIISIDGTTGVIYAGAVPVVPSPVTTYLQGNLKASEYSPVIYAVDQFLRYADAVRVMGVRTNADTPEDAATARRLGAEGIGLTRTEHMFLGERRSLVEALVLTDEESERKTIISEMEKLQFADFLGIFKAMDGLPVTIRLLDPPLHEFLTDRTTLAVNIATKEAKGEVPTEREIAMYRAVNRWHESNPMMGLRGVRLGVLIPELFTMQVRAITLAALEAQRGGTIVRPEIMIPLVASQRELLYFRSTLEAEIARVLTANDSSLDIKIGSMIETPRAAITAAKLADYSDFFSFGTNDLTQLTWAFSRDDAESSFLPRYLDLELLPFSPFESLDQDGVGLLVKLAVEEIRKVKPKLKLGVCGEHGGDPLSIHFFQSLDLDYVSCSPFRVPIARLEAGRAFVLQSAKTGNFNSNNA
jgi:pyruvate,orthophosphate dikinase